MPTRRVIAVSSVLALAAATMLALPAGPARAASVNCVDPAEQFFSGHDINADARYDVVVGVPNATVGGAANAGAVDVHYRKNPDLGPTQRIDESSFGGLLGPAAGDRFGAATALMNVLDAGGVDECADLAIGVPGLGHGRGAVIVARGATSGLVATQAIRINGPAAGEGFGSAVVASDSDLWVGAPNRSVAGHAGAGAVYHYRINGTTASLVQVVTENTAGVPGAAETGDHFGQVLGNWGRRYLVVGRPSEDIGRFVNAGAVTVLTMSFTTGLVTKAEEADENSPGVSGNPESGDHFGASLSISATADGLPETFRGWWVAVGVPGEGLGTKAAAGEVYVFRVSPTQRLTQHSTITQETNGVAGGSESGDRFGAAVAIDGYLRALVGVPGEDLGTVRDAGDVVNLALSNFPNACVYRQGLAGACGLGGTLTAGARAGSAISFLSIDNEDHGGFAGGDALLIGVPGADPSGVPEAGEVVVPGASATEVYTDSAGPQPHEQYGVVPYSMNNGIGGA